MKTKNVLCNNCQNKTDHTLLLEKVINGSEPYTDDIDICWSYTYRLLECNGCHEIQLEKEHWFSEWDNTEVIYFPPHVYRKEPSWISDVPIKQKELIEELYIALAADCKSLVVMGARTLIDLFINDKIGDVGTFEQKLDNLEKNGFVSSVQKTYLSAALNAGNAVIHRGFKPTTDVVNKVLDIIENLLITYSLETKKKVINKVTPKRKRTSKKTTKGPVNKAKKK